MNRRVIKKTRFQVRSDIHIDVIRPGARHNLIKCLLEARPTVRYESVRNPGIVLRPYGLWPCNRLQVFDKDG